jgi:nucleotide-binding universal stress UspA family protein
MNSRNTKSTNANGTTTNYEHRRNWTGHSDGRPPPATSGHRERIDLPVGSFSPSFDEDLVMSGATGEAALALTPLPRFQSLLVPVDGEPFAEHALPLALEIALRAGAEVRVVHVHCALNAPYFGGWPHYDSGLDVVLRRRRQAYLDDLFRRLKRVTSVPVTPVFWRGREVADALREMTAAGTDLVVMATHGRGALGRFMFGGVADALMRRLSVPLLLVRGNGTAADLTAGPPVRHVLIPLDGSESSERVLEPALALGALLEADQTLLRVVPMPADHLAGYEGEARQVIAEQWRLAARNDLRRVTRRLDERSHRVHPEVVFDERPTARAILRYARSHGADLIAMATRGRGGLARLLRGSVAGRVVRGSAVPVLVVPPAMSNDETQPRNEEARKPMAIHGPTPAPVSGRSRTRTDSKVGV